MKGVEGVGKIKILVFIFMFFISRGYSRCIKKEVILINFGY